MIILVFHIILTWRCNEKLTSLLSLTCSINDYNTKNGNGQYIFIHFFLSYKEKSLIGEPVRRLSVVVLTIGTEKFLRHRIIIIVKILYFTIVEQKRKCPKPK